MQALLGLVDAVDVLVDCRLEAVRHWRQHVRVCFFCEVDDARQDHRRQVVDRRARFLCQRGRRGAEVDVEVDGLEHRAFQLVILALVADLDRRDCLSLLGAALFELLDELGDDRLSERVDQVFFRRHVVGVDPAHFSASALAREKGALRLEVAVAPAVRSARAHRAWRLLRPLADLHLFSLIALSRRHLDLDLCRGLLDVLGELVAEVLQGEHGAVVHRLDVLSCGLRNVDALSYQVALVLDLLRGLFEDPSEERVRCLAYALRRDAEVRLQQGNRQLDGIFIHA